MTKALFYVAYLLNIRLFILNMYKRRVKVS